MFRFLDFDLDEERQELRCQGEPVPIQRKPLAILLELVHSFPGAVSTQELLAAIWPDAVVTKNSVSRAVRQLRRALEASPEGSSVVRTVRGYGYALAVPLKVEGGGRPAPVPAEPPDAFVGRTRELGRLGNALEAASRGPGGVVLLVGEAGIGKTRIAQHFARQAGARGTRVLWGACYEGAWAPPYAPFAEALGAYVEVTSPAQLRRDVGRLAPALAEVLPGLRAALPDLPPVAPLSPDAQRHRLLEAAAEALLGIARRAPLLLVVEDLHWADVATLRMLRRLGRATARGRLLIVGSYRKEEVRPDDALIDALASLEREATCERLELTGLDLDDVAGLLRDANGREPSRAVCKAIYAATDGNPFFVRELVLQLRKGRALEEISDARAIERHLENLGAPQGVRHLIRRRLSTLSKDARLVIEAGATFGGAFPLEVIRRVRRLSESASLDALDELLEAQLLCVSSRGLYAFPHALVRWAIHTESNPSRRARLHLRVARALEAWCAGDPQRYAVELARQYHHSAPLAGAERGVAHCLAAAAHAERLAAFDAMAEYLRMALDLLPPGDSRQSRLLARLALALAWNGRAEAAAETAKRSAEALASREGADAAADHLAQAAQAIWWSGFGPVAWRLAPVGLRLLEGRRNLTWARLMMFELWRREAADPDFPGIPQDCPERREVSRIILDDWDRLDAQEKNDLFATALAFSSREEVVERAGDVPVLLGFWAGEYRRARALALEVADQTLERGSHSAAVLFLTAGARCELALGRLAAAEATYARALDAASRVEPTPELATLLHAFPVDRALTLDEGWDRELRFMQQFFAGATRETRWIVANGMAFCAALAARAGHRETAESLLPEVMEIVERAPGWSLGYTWTIHSAAEALWFLERAEGVEVVERNLRKKTLAPDFRHPHADARLSLARLCALTGRFSEALAELDAARRVLEEQGARPLRAVVDFDEALVRIRRTGPGDRARAGACLEAARRQFAQIGMTGWLRRSESLADGAATA
jgi:DNA-binding winged helix-turn-helix (wHTH) protein/tetratricopeptide (TPR) repeat protein